MFIHLSCTDFSETFFIMAEGGKLLCMTLFCSFKSNVLVQCIPLRSSWHRHILTWQFCHNSVTAGKRVELAARNSNTLNYKEQSPLWSLVKVPTPVKKCNGSNYNPAQIRWGALFQHFVLSLGKNVYQLEATVTTSVDKGGEWQHQWTREELWMLCIWSSVRPLQCSPTTSIFWNWRDMDLMGAMLGGWGIGWMVISRE